MKAHLDVKDRDERDAVLCAWADPATRAFIITIGNLLQLPTDRSRARVLNFVVDHCAEAREVEL